jgi:hypothetical protein
MWMNNAVAVLSGILAWAFLPISFVTMNLGLNQAKADGRLGVIQTAQR